MASWMTHRLFPQSCLNAVELFKMRRIKDWKTFSSIQSIWNDNRGLPIVYIKKGVKEPRGCYATPIKGVGNLAHLSRREIRGGLDEKGVIFAQKY